MVAAEHTRIPEPEIQNGGWIPEVDLALERLQRTTSINYHCILRRKAMLRHGRRSSHLGLVAKIPSECHRRWRRLAVFSAADCWRHTDRCHISQSFAIVHLWAAEACRRLRRTTIRTRRLDDDKDAMAVRAVAAEAERRRVSFVAPRQLIGGNVSRETAHSRYTWSSADPSTRSAIDGSPAR